MDNNSSNVTGKSLIRAGWNTLSADRELLALPLLGSLFAILTAVPFALAYILIPADTGLFQYIPVVAMIIIYNFMIVLFAVALAAGASKRMNGEDPTVRSTLSCAWTRRSAIMQWALLTTSVTLLLRLIEQRFPVAGRVFSALGSLTWVIASYFVIPVIAVEKGSGIDALKSSARVIEQRWGKALRFNLRVLIYKLAIVVITAALVIASLINIESNTSLAFILGASAIIFLIFTAFLLSAVSAVARVALYRYAVGLPVPGFEPKILDRAVKLD